MKIVFVLCDDCHRSSPYYGVQPLPVAGIHNSGWQQSPGMKIVRQFHEGTVSNSEKRRLQDYIIGVLTAFKDDERILMWDVYNEPGQNGLSDVSHVLLQHVWQWAREIRPSQPLTACLRGTEGNMNLKINAMYSDVITFHCYDGSILEERILYYKKTYFPRPVICTEYMARELGTTFRFSLPLFQEYRIGCYNWGLVAGKSQTHFNWESVKHLEERKERGEYIQPDGNISEPELWFHDIFRMNGTPFDKEEVNFIRTACSTSDVQ